MLNWGVFIFYDGIDILISGVLVMFKFLIVCGFLFFFGWVMMILNFFGFDFLVMLVFCIVEFDMVWWCFWCIWICFFFEFWWVRFGVDGGNCGWVVVFGFFCVLLFWWFWCLFDGRGLSLVVFGGVMGNINGGCG